MREFPIFVPYGGEHLAAVVTLPDDDPSGLVLLATGTGAPRSHRFQLWTQAARRLADQGLASVRMDYLGSGDSTGRVVERRLGELELRVAEASAVARFAMGAVGVDRLVAVGNCSGGLVVLGASAGIPESIGTICILPRVLQPTSVNRMVIGLRGSKLSSVVRSNRVLHKLADPLRGRKGKPRQVVRDWMQAMLSKGRLLFIYSLQDTDAYNEQSQAAIERILASLPAEQRERFELEVLPEGPLSGFETISIQHMTIDAVVDWAVRCFAQTSDGRNSGGGTERRRIPAQ
jgi:dienelactone hydrolase